MSHFQDETTQRMIEDFSSRLEAMTTAHVETLSYISAHTLFKDLQALQPSPPLPKRIAQGVCRVGKRVGCRLLAHHFERRSGPGTEPLVVIEGTYRVLADEPSLTKERD